MAIIAGGIATLAMTGGLALPIAAPIMTLGTNLINTYTTGKSAVALATEVALPQITTVAKSLMSDDLESAILESSGKAAANTITSKPRTSSRDELESAILDSDEIKSNANTKTTDHAPEPDHEPPSLS
ncbi:MAG: hypothetical protein P1U39_02495 [Legionellaceae bacterium]|nr:hypothetical protein [Legionellaceae bacterium]